MPYKQTTPGPERTCPRCGAVHVRRHAYCTDCHTAWLRERKRLRKGASSIAKQLGSKRAPWTEEARKLRNSAYNRMTRYGLSPCELTKMRINTFDTCEICWKPVTLSTLHVDHDHLTHKVRGILCGRCNCALGFIDEDPGTLQSMAKYLRKHYVG